MEIEKATTAGGAVGDYATKCPTCGGTDYRMVGRQRKCTNRDCEGMSADPFADLR
jgi:hypothetical protein